MHHRIVVFTGDLSYAVRAGIVQIDLTVPGLAWLVVVHSPHRSAKVLVRNQWRNLRRNGWRWIPYHIGDAMRRAVTIPETPSRSISQECTLEALASRSNVRVLRVDDIHGEVTIAEIRAFSPELGISLAAPILREPLYLLPRLGTLNLHKGKLPLYRGMPAAFWELWNSEKRVGCTVHWVDAKLDTGAIVVESSVQREAFSTLRGLQLRLDEVGIDLMRNAVVRIFTGNVTSSPQPAGGRTYRKPTLAQKSELNRRLARSGPRGAKFPVRAVREVTHAATYAAWRAGLRLAIRQRITVLLYHRVSDETRDNLTVGIEQFDRQMALIQRHC